VITPGETPIEGETAQAADREPDEFSITPRVSSFAGCLDANVWTMSQTLRIRPGVHDAIAREASAAFPDECCGVLAGRGDVIETIYPVRNTAEDARTRFEMDPAEMWAARRQATREGLEVLGFYHSHPRTPPVPSSYDIERAYYSDAVYLIAGLSPGFSVRAFRISGGSADEVSIEIESAER